MTLGMKLRIGVASDDLITHDVGGDSVEVGTPEMSFRLQVPSDSHGYSRDVKIRVSYESSGWEFEIDLPDGTTVVAEPPEEE